MVETVMLVIVGTVIAAFLLALRGKRGGKQAPAFKARLFMSANEMEFLGRLEAAVPELRFHAQVAMGALLDPAMEKQGNSRAWQQARNMFSQKIVDYVAQRRDNGKIVAVIELDDRTHKADKDARRDAMLQQAGLRTVRWQSKAKPGSAEILAALLGAPPAPAAIRPVPSVPVATTSVRGELWGRSTAPSNNK
ncbi:MAG: hypothetical protein JWP59_1359 [Massilia sp.]|nr:hypothetical protein [Massilia sp.]